MKGWERSGENQGEGQFVRQTPKQDDSAGINLYRGEVSAAGGRGGNEGNNLPARRQKRVQAWEN